MQGRVTLMLAALAAALLGPCDSFIALCPRGAAARLLAARGPACRAPGTQQRCAATRPTRKVAATSTRMGADMGAGTLSFTHNQTRQAEETASASADRLRATRRAAALRHHQRVRHCALNPCTLQSFASTAAAHNSNSVAAWRASRRRAPGVLAARGCQRVTPLEFRSNSYLPCNGIETFRPVTGHTRQRATALFGTADSAGK